jgi:hypothetical protein
LELKLSPVAGWVEVLLDEVGDRAHAQSSLSSWKIKHFEIIICGFWFFRYFINRVIKRLGSVTFLSVYCEGIQNHYESSVFSPVPCKQIMNKLYKQSFYKYLKILMPKFQSCQNFKVAKISKLPKFQSCQNFKVAFWYSLHFFYLILSYFPSLSHIYFKTKLIVHLILI